MIMRQSRFLLSAFVTALFALSLAFVAHGHRMPLVDNLAAYAMPDGTLPEFCLDASGPDSAKHGDHDPCPACTLVKSLALSEPVGLPVPSGRMQLLRSSLPDRPLVTAHAPRAPPARGPPALVLI